MNWLNCFKKTPVSNYVADNVIICDLNGFIKSVSYDALYILSYEQDMLIDKFIGTIMSPFMSYIHSTVLLPKYKSASKFERNLMHMFLNGKTTKRPLIIYTITKQPLYVSISVSVIADENNNTLFRLKFDVIDDFANSTVYLSGALNPQLFAKFHQTKNNLIFANIEYNNSSIDYTEPNEVSLYIRFQDDIIGIIKRDFYPYIYVYEMTNHGCVVVSNLCVTYNMPRFCASLMLCFLKNMYTTMSAYAILKVGISYDKAYIGAISNDQIRLFGRAYDDAKYNCDFCSPYEICTSHEFIYKLKQENVYNTEYTYSKQIYDDDDAKMQKHNFIDLTKIDDKILHESSHEKVGGPRSSEPPLTIKP